MAAKGTFSKKVVFDKLQEIFPDSFWEDQDKILRIPLDEDGSRVEIKVTLTAAKTNLGGNTVASAFPAPSEDVASAFMAPPVGNASIEMTEEEKERVSTLLASLGL